MNFKSSALLMLGQEDLEVTVQPMNIDVDISIHPEPYSVARKGRDLSDKTPYALGLAHITGSPLWCGGFQYMPYYFTKNSCFISANGAIFYD